MHRGTQQCWDVFFLVEVLFTVLSAIAESLSATELAQLASFWHRNVKYAYNLRGGYWQNQVSEYIWRDWYCVTTLNLTGGHFVDRKKASFNFIDNIAYTILTGTICSYNFRKYLPRTRKIWRSLQANVEMTCPLVTQNAYNDAKNGDISRAQEWNSAKGSSNKPEVLPLPYTLYKHTPIQK